MYGARVAYRGSQRNWESLQSETHLAIAGFYARNPLTVRGLAWERPVPGDE
jgi:hypothetical protein